MRQGAQEFAKQLAGWVLVAASSWGGMTGLATAGPLPRSDIPKSLQDWLPWAMHGQASLLCPPAFNNEADKACTWPSDLSLHAEADGARFRYEVQVYGPAALLALPGEPGRWPTEVRADGQALPIAEQSDRPVALLAPGRHVIEGRIAWQEMPTDIRLPQGVGCLTVSIGGQTVQRTPDNEGRIWLKQAPEVEQKSGESYTVHTARRIDDQVPLRVTTHIDIDVSGKAREIVLPVVLLNGLVPVSLESALPARLTDGGALSLQARPGHWTVTLDARLMSPVLALSLPRQATAGEVWSFEAHNDVRLVSIEGAPSIDPRQVAMPEDWRGLPAYRLEPGGTLKLTQSRRGNPEPPPDRLRLQRELWLDFDGKGYTAHDEISGTLSRSSRLEMAPPAVLGRASVDGEDQSITQQAGDGPQGFEVRGGTARLSADSRIEADVRTLPATGWRVDMNQASTRLNLPPGWRLLHATGVDSASGSWLSRWTLWDFFFVLLSALAAGKLFGLATGGLLGLAMVLSWHMPGAPQTMWLALLGLHALRRVLPAGRLIPWVHTAERGAALLIALVLLPYAVEQVRLSIYPSLERPWQAMGETDTLARDRSEAAPAPATQAEEAGSSMVNSKADAPPPPTPSPAGASSDDSMSGISRKLSQSSAPVLPEPIIRPPMEQDPSARVQTGPGLPRWQWNTHTLTWQGPVQATQDLHLVLLPPTGTVALRLLSLALMVAALWRIVGQNGRAGTGWPPAWTQRPHAAVASTMLACAVISLGLLAPPSPAQAAPAASPAAKESLDEPVAPSPDTLDELRQRLTAAPDCMPHCADVARMLVTASGSRIQLRQEVHTLADVAVPLPGQGNNWRPSLVSVDGRPATTRRDPSGALWIVLPRGINQVVLEADAGQATGVDITLPLPARKVHAQAEGWTLSGLDGHGQASNALSLSRTQVGAVSADGGTQRDALPPFVRVQRTLHLGLRWTIETRIDRIAPSMAPVRVKVRLASGESVTDDTVEVKDGIANVLLGTGGAGDSSRFVSTLATAPRITLDSLREPNQIEQWTLDASTQWHTRLSGIAPVVHQAQGRWMPTWQPWPGEQVVIDVSRPVGVAGQTFTVDKVHTTVTPGARATDVTAEAGLRSSQGGNHQITLPVGDELLGLSVDGQTLPVLASKGQVTVPITPGAHQLRVDWREARGMGPRFDTAGLTLGAAGVNDTLTVNVPTDRVVLAVGGPAVGPAVLFWGVLVVIIAVALALGRWNGSPLSALSWVLLGLGVAQMSLMGIAVVVGWFLLMEARGRWGASLAPRSLKVAQVLLALWAVLAAGVLLGTVRMGLLGYPDLMVMGNGSNASQLHWYADRLLEQSTASAWIVSMPVLLYRGLMLLWALWLAASMLRWIRWAWERYSAGGYWPGKASDEPQPAPVPASDTDSDDFPDADQEGDER